MMHTDRASYYDPCIGEGCPHCERRTWMAAPSSDLSIVVACAVWFLAGLAWGALIFGIVQSRTS